VDKYPKIFQPVPDGEEYRRFYYQARRLGAIPVVSSIVVNEYQWY
jgi:hypothetical protein